MLTQTPNISIASALAMALQAINCLLADDPALEEAYPENNEDVWQASEVLFLKHRMMPRGDKHKAFYSTGMGALKELYWRRDGISRRRPIRGSKLAQMQDAIIVLPWLIEESQTEEDLYWSQFSRSAIAEIERMLELEVE